ncbi:hypothetical protein K402DRAFT_417096 [Aulographum hederae CBS 113979]|uniref:Uncharacterized protein n=1 Tax=Aulographum hederae CBS 113979 TaxID=1176131 RepID=A0A6G1HCR0_9PEZI|nr:hypothetical protein K402DRAFT_417096 [Aulographum hederae CBS 113979]
MAILAQLEPAQQMIQALAREEQGRENVKGGKSDLGLIMMRVDRIEKTVSANRTSQDHQQGAGPGAKPTWSEVAAGGKNRATLEVRLEPNGSQGTDESKLHAAKAVAQGLFAVFFVLLHGGVVLVADYVDLSRRTADFVFAFAVFRA